MPNETYEIEVASPLLRPGLLIRTKVSKKYVVETVNGLMDMIREINSKPTVKGIEINSKPIVEGIDHDRFVDREWCPRSLLDTTKRTPKV